MNDTPHPSQQPDARGPNTFGTGGERPPREPVFNLPTGILVALGLLVVIYAVQSLLMSPTLEESFVVNFGFSPARYVYPLSEQGLEWLWSPVTYSLLHGSIEHIVFNGLWLAAFGTPVYRRIGATRFVVFWILSSIASAALHAALNWGEPSLMIGASGVVSALMGSACRFAFGGPERHAKLFPGGKVPRLSIGQALQERTVLVFTAAWLFGNLAIAFGLPLFGDMSAQIAWDAHIGGFLFGFLFFGAFDR
ncbi:rhomboid family intramembrane serine protease [Agrobacterium sp. ES01]|uniref:rhomboid family intramembrane serine protease n=1 Tax=Agrobacterium sp. ES01 TaxID=3420714 RepID=UPI003D112839